MIVLLYIERILSFSLRHKMYVFKVCVNGFLFLRFAESSLFHVISNSSLATFVAFFVFCILVFNYFFDDLLGQRSKPGSHVFASSLTASKTKRANLTWLALEIMHRGHTWHDYSWPWVSLTWLLYNLQLDDVPGADFENSLYAFGQSEKR